MKLRDFIDRLLDLNVKHGDAEVYVLAEDEDGGNFYKEVNKVEFDMDGIYVTYDESIDREMKFKELDKFKEMLEHNNNQCLSLCILTDMDEMSELIEDSKKIRSYIRYLEKELGVK